MSGFTVRFAENLRACQIVDDQGRRLLTVAISGEVDIERQDRIAQLAARLYAECQGMDAVIAPFVAAGPAS